MSEFELSGRKCRFEQCGSDSTVVFIGGLSEHTSALIETIRTYTEQKPISIFAFDLPDWMNACAPWSSELSGERIIGKADETLDWIVREALPFVRERCGQVELMISGYSMAGLLALWSLYRTDVFSAAACCSGSLWYPGWIEFAEQNKIRGENVSVYLSLGGKEGSTAVPHMKSIEANTRRQYDLFKRDPKICDVVLEMNPGGHFTKVNERQAKGIARLINRRTK